MVTHKKTVISFYIIVILLLFLMEPAAKLGSKWEANANPVEGVTVVLDEAELTGVLHRE